MPEITDYQIAEAMKAIGGSFVQGLGELWFRADERNRLRLTVAFAEYFTEYRDLVAKMAARHARP